MVPCVACDLLARVTTFLSNSSIFADGAMCPSLSVTRAKLAYCDLQSKAYRPPDLRLAAGPPTISQ